ncbi:hypothetical protein [uncultured Oscillibacter sp.]|uniref:hypothetical protein n=1 Tax=uncultured Oscillibacter sp. TaxID=876091 RepID=UPI0025CD4C1F|nr:hypothetical protein [uncultured Oscillibacter sp.]
MLERLSQWISLILKETVGLVKRSPADPAAFKDAQMREISGKIWAERCPGWFVTSALKARFPVILNGGTSRRRPVFGENRVWLRLPALQQLRGAYV